MSRTINRYPKFLPKEKMNVQQTEWEREVVNELDMEMKELIKELVINQFFFNHKKLIAERFYQERIQTSEKLFIKMGDITFKLCEILGNHLKQRNEDLVIPPYTKQVSEVS